MTLSTTCADIRLNCSTGERRPCQARKTHRSAALRSCWLSARRRKRCSRLRWTSSRVASVSAGCLGGAGAGGRLAETKVWRCACNASTWLVASTSHPMVGAVCSACRTTERPYSVRTACWQSRDLGLLAAPVTLALKVAATGLWSTPARRSFRSGVSYVRPHTCSCSKGGIKEDVVNEPFAAWGLCQEIRRFPECENWWVTSKRNSAAKSNSSHALGHRGCELVVAGSVGELSKRAFASRKRMGA